MEKNINGNNNYIILYKPLMIDQPIPAKILLPLLNANDTGEAFISLSTLLYQYNLIFSEPRELRRVGNTLELIVTFQDRTSCENWQKHPRIKAYWQKEFDKFLTEKPSTVEEQDVIITADGVVNCTCQNPDFYILEGRSYLFVDELTCGSCVGRVPYSGIPKSIEIDRWQRHHQRTYMNWMDSSFFEVSALAELTNYKTGTLNREGEKIRQQLAAYFKIPVYISYFEEGPELSNKCLICEGEGGASGLSKPLKICKVCHTVFGYGEKEE